MSTIHRVMTCVLLSGFFVPTAEGAICQSRYGTTEHSLTSLKRQDYEICYDSTLERDADFVKRWVDKSYSIARQKYNISIPRDSQGNRMFITIFLPPSSTNRTGRGYVQNTCCKNELGTTYAEVHYLSPSSPDWGLPPLGGLQFTNASDYHAHYVVHEMMNLLHYTIDNPQPKGWIREGLAEYDGYMHTTSYNKSVAIPNLLAYVDRTVRDRIICCKTLGSTETIATDSVYYGGALIMLFVAEVFGEGTHKHLFHMSLESVVGFHGWTMQRFFNELRLWLDNKIDVC